MLNLKSASLATLLAASSLVTFTNPSSAAIRSYTVHHTYRGVNRCGRADENIKEARLAAEAKVRQIESTTEFKTELKNFKILSADTKHKKDRWGKRSCTTHLKLRVEVDIQV